MQFHCTYPFGNGEGSQIEVLWLLWIQLIRPLVLGLTKYLQKVLVEKDQCPNVGITGHNPTCEKVIFTLHNLCNTPRVYNSVRIIPVGKITVYGIPELLFWKIRNALLINHTWYIRYTERYTERNTESNGNMLATFGENMSTGEFL